MTKFIHYTSGLDHITFFFFGRTRRESEKNWSYYFWTVMLVNFYFLTVNSVVTMFANLHFLFHNITRTFDLIGIYLLGVCASVLKKICYENGLVRWPYRKVGYTRMIYCTHLKSEVSLFRSINIIPLRDFIAK